MIQAEITTRQTGFWQRLARGAGIYDGEGIAFSLLFGQSFFFGIAFVTYFSSANALFLSHYSAQKLPYVYIIAAGIIILSGLIFLRLQSNLPFSTLLIGNLGSMLAAITVMRLLLAWSDARWIFFLMLVGVRVLWALGNLGLWTLAGQLFTSQQGKRLFSLIMAGGVLSIILMGFLNSVLNRWLGTHNMLWITAVSLLAAFCLLVVTIRRFQAALALPGEKPKITPKQNQSNHRSIFRDRYIWLIFLFTILSTIGSYVLDFAFVGQAGAQFAGADQLSKFFGNYMGISTLMMLIVLLMVSNRFFRRFGVRGGLLVDPVLVAIGTLGVILLSSFPDVAGILFWVVVATKMSDEVSVVAMNNTSVRIMYQPLPQHARSRVQTMVESVVAPLSMGISGVLLLLFTTLWNLTPLQAVYILVFILVFWLLMGVLLGRQYYGALQNALDKRYLGDSEVDIFAESAGLAALEKHLQSKNPRDVLFAIEMLAQNNPAKLVNALPQLLTHANSSVRLTAVQQLTLQNEDTLPWLEVLVQDISQPVAVRAAALRQLATIGGAAAQVLSAYLSDANLELRLAAMVGVLHSNSPEGTFVAGEILAAAQNDSSPEMRCFAARVIGVIGAARFYSILLLLLDDSEIVVRQEALRACQTVHHPRIWPRVVAALYSPDTRQAARRALVVGGESALPFIADALHQVDAAPVTLDLVRICGQIGGSRVIPILQAMISTPRERVRSEVLHILARHHYRAAPETRADILRQVDAEIAALHQLVQTSIELTGQLSHVVQPLSNILTQMLARGRERIIHLLALIYDAQAILRVQANLLSGQKDKRANAIEVLDIILSQDRKLRDRLIPIITSQTPLHLAKEFSLPAGEIAEQLQVLYAQEDIQLKNNWLAICALYALLELAPEVANTLLEAALGHPEDIVRKTARGVLRRRDKTDGDFPMMLTIEKVLILKTVSIFAETPDDLLAELAAYLEERHVAAGQVIFEKGDPGDSMYIIVAGKVRVHDGGRTLNELSDRDVFGEMALLDPAPRSASITASEDTYLLCLDHDPFYEAVDTRSEIARGVIQVLSQKIRGMIEEG
ncbi:MAG: cyclic nucleotide-binding domain-containing protein [Anaerolineae bacterium]|nr:cyclic nucleotide-binding domain-containing protein [Anaerolineae bacterium]